MKKNKLLMPIIGISATVASLVPLTSLASCNKVEALKVELDTSKSTKEKKLYANTSVAYFYFKQNDLVNYAKTRVKLVNLKINGADATVVSGLVKMAVDSAGGMRVTIDVATIYNHYNNPSSIEFDLVFTNTVTKQKVTISGFSLSADQETKVPSPFEVDTSDDTIITGFTEDLSKFKAEDFANAKYNGKNIFLAFDIPVGLKDQKTKLTASAEAEKDEKEAGEAGTEIETIEVLYYRMIIPAYYKKIGTKAFAGTLSKTNIVSLEFENGSNMSELGSEAFAGSSLVFVTLPDSILSIGASCFQDSVQLTSCQFPASLKNPGATIKLLPGTFVHTSIPYIKIPTYVSHLVSDNMPVLVSSTQTAFVDFSEWPTALLHERANTLFAGQTISCQSAIQPLVVDKTAATELDNVQGKTKWIPSIIPYDIKADSSGAILAPTSVSKDVTTFTETWMKISDELQKVGLPFKYELPNIFIKDTTTQQITSIDPNFYGAYTTQLNVKKALSSVVLPKGLTYILDGAFANPDSKNITTNLWQIHIPLNVVNLGKSILDSNQNFTSIVYDGTQKQWELLKDNSSVGWSSNIPTSTTVICSDNTFPLFNK